MLMKMTADPEKQLASIEFWIMGSFADVTADKFLGVFPWVLLGIAGLFLLHRQILLLSLEEEEARMLGVPRPLDAADCAAAGYAGHRRHCQRHRPDFPSSG